MSAHLVALDALLTADDPGAALGELLALAALRHEFSDTLPEHCRMCRPAVREEHPMAGIALAWRDALTWELVADIVEYVGHESPVEVTITRHGTDGGPEERSFRTWEFAEAWLKERLTSLGWRLL